MHEITLFSNKIPNKWKCFSLSKQSENYLSKVFQYNNINESVSSTISHAHVTKFKSFTSIHIIYCKPSGRYYIGKYVYYYWSEGNNLIQAKRSESNRGDRSIDGVFDRSLSTSATTMTHCSPHCTLGELKGQKLHFVINPKSNKYRIVPVSYLCAA